MNKKQLLYPVLVLVLGIVLGAMYTSWLDAGCESVGAMTYEGRQCLDIYGMKARGEI